VCLLGKREQVVRAVCDKLRRKLKQIAVLSTLGTSFCDEQPANAKVVLSPTGLNATVEQMQCM
jgi:hypothetical protein